MKQSQIEQKIMARMFMYINAPLEQFRLEDSEILELIDCAEYNDFTPEFQAWLTLQLDTICTAQGQ